MPDTQATVEAGAAIAEVVHALATHLADHHDAGEALLVADSWRIDQNRWSACRHGLDGELIDLVTGERRPTRDRLAALADRLGVAMPAGDGAARQRAVAADRGLDGLVAWLADRFVG